MADETCELFPDVPRDQVASVTVWRVMVDEKGAEHLFTLPYRWPADVTPEAIGECAGGGMFRAQPRGRSGAYLKGVKPTQFVLDGDPRPFAAPGAMPPVAGAAEAPTVPLDAATTVGASGSASTPATSAAIAVPVAQPLAGMPAAVLDLHALPPESRALVGVLYQLNAYTWQSIQNRSGAETDARERVAGIALKSMEELGRVSSSALSTTAQTAQRELDTARGRIAELEGEVRELRSTREADRVELAILRTRLGLNLPAPQSPAAPSSRGVLDVLQAVMLEAVRTLGVPIVATSLGISPERLKELTADSTTHRAA